MGEGGEEWWWFLGEGASAAVMSNIACLSYSPGEMASGEMDTTRPDQDQGDCPIDLRPGEGSRAKRERGRGRGREEEAEERWIREIRRC